MKIAYNPKSGAALQTAPDNNDITFDLAGKTIYARGEGFKGTDTTYDIFRKASESVGGQNGLVPAPDYNSNSKNRFLKEDGTWVIPNAGTLNGYPESNFFRYRGDINSAYVDLTNYEKNAENFASYNPGMYNILKNGHSELFINFAKNIGSTSSLELKTSYNNDDYLYIRKVIDNNRVSGAWRPLAFADNTVRSVTLNNNQLRINTNGTNNDLTIPYATNTSNIISSKLENSNSYGSETGISWSLASSTNNGTYGTAIDSNGFNVNNNANGILWLGTHEASTNGGYGGQLGISSNSNIYYRYISNGSFPNAWNKIVFERDLTALNIKLTGYQLDADNFESITSNDTVSSALSKLECKTQFVYDWLMSDADDADEKINKWHEVEHFLEGIEETTLNSILNTKADKATTIQGYGLWEKYADLNEVPMGAFFCGGTSVANSPASGSYISGLTLAKDVNAQFRTQLGFVENRVFTRQENGANNWSQWRELAFLGDVAKKATTLAGYGITDAVTLNTEQTITRVKTFTNGIKTPIIVNQTSDNALFIGATDNYYCDLNTQLSPGYSAIIPLFQKIGSATSTTGDFGSARKGVIRLSGNASESQLLFDHYNATIHYRGSTSNGAFTEWKRLAFKETTLSGYGITDAVKYCYGADDIRHSASGYAQITHGGKVNGMLLSGIYKETSLYGGQLNGAFDGSSIWYRGLNNGTFTEWKRIAFTDGLVANADNATWLIPNSGLAYGNSGLQYFNLNGTQGTITNANVTPNAGWYHIIRQNHANSLGYFSDIATPLNDAEMKYGLYWRAVSNGINYGWYNLLDSNNYSKYAVPFLNMVNASNLKSIGVGYVNANGANGENGGIISFGSVSHQTQIHSDYSGGNIHWRVNSNGSLTNWKNLLDSNNYSNYAVTLGTEQIITGRKTFKNDGYYTSIFNSTLSDDKVRLLLMNNDEAKLMLAYDGLGSFLYDYGSEQILRIQNDGDLLFTKNIIASSQLKSNVATGTAPLVVNSTTMVANLNANYLGGLNKDSFQKAVYDYVNVSGTADTTALPTVLAPSIYNGTNSIGGQFKFYDTKFYNGQSNTSNRCQLAYGYDVDSIHFRRYYNGTWYDWKKVVFTEGTDNLKITNSSARTTYVKDSTHSMFFGYSDGSYNRGLYDNSQSNWIMYTDSSNQTFINQWLGNVGIKTGNATLTAALQVGGSILASGDITAYSDRRLKSNIQTLENRGYIEPVTFEKDGKQCIGFVAQDVKEKYPELVNSEGEYLSLNYQQYTAVLQAQIIELDKRIKELENGFSKQ